MDCERTCAEAVAACGVVEIPDWVDPAGCQGHRGVPGELPAGRWEDREPFGAPR
ncbi:MAG TPA: hypothetical protein VFX70_18410 [Mycobacteriales bacterium]|nr:hypothetical protein [Mycobacteriales bacterium]